MININKFDLSKIKIGETIFIISDNVSSEELIDELIYNTRYLSIYYKPLSVLRDSYHFMDEIMNTSEKNGIIVLNNCLTGEEYNLNKLIINAKYYGLIVIIVSNNPSNFGQQFRNNIDYVFQNLNGYNYTEKLYERYFSVLPTFDTYSHLLNDLKHNRHLIPSVDVIEYLVLDNTVKTNDLFEMISYVN